MNKPLKQSVRDHFDTHSLSEDQLMQLESLAKPATPAIHRRPSFFPVTLAGAIAAFLIAFLLTPYLVDESSIAERIAMEVVNNHLKLKPLEVETNNMETIRSYFNKLDFMPVSSRLLKQPDLELLGGRYCSLQGIAAAQLRVRQTGTDHLQTLYQAEYRKDVFADIPTLEDGDTPVNIYVKGVKVTLWVEKGLLFALTGIADD